MKQVRRVKPINREQNRALDVANRMRKVLGLKEVTTIPVAKNPIQSLLNNKAFVNLSDNELKVRNSKKAAQLATVLNLTEADCYQSASYTVIPLPRAVAVFNEKIVNERYENLVV